MQTMLRNLLKTPNQLVTSKALFFKALRTPIAGVATRRRKLWRSQLPGKSGL
jgi:hypothetical protein